MTSEKEDAQEFPETRELMEVVANATDLDDTLFVIDTACKGGNVVKDPALLDQLTRSTAKVTGVSDTRRRSPTWESFHSRDGAS